MSFWSLNLNLFNFLVYRKHHPPKKGDKIWRLEGIGKDGTYDTRLSAVNIKTVDDFLKVYHEEGGAYLRKVQAKDKTSKSLELRW